ncbi:MAG: hypothetical protein GYA62_01935 [Bacteroidales bacterium]|nr:hypothetical protein [Bacteroidales bacterium]
MNTISDISVLFFPFSRPLYARQTFDAIKKVKPKKFYFYCDKAREGKDEEIKNNNIIRNYIKEIDWECDLKTWFRDENIGVYQSILDAIDWFFEYEEMGIILEEDCLPSIAFFDFCRQLLPKYKDDKRVWFISGNNMIEKYYNSKYDYIFCNTSYQWGWATWRDRWQSVNRNMFNVNEIIDYKLHRQLLADKKISNFEVKNLQKWKDKNGFWNPKSWDYKFQLSMTCNGGLAIIPKYNLVSNIGTMGFNSSRENKTIHNIKVLEVENYPIKIHPPFIVSDFNFTQMFYKRLVFRNRNLFQVVIQLLKKIL